jgi:hypothetical protein
MKLPTPTSRPDDDVTLVGRSMHVYSLCGEYLCARTARSRRGSLPPLAEVAEAAGIGRTTLHKDYATRDDLLLAVGHRAGEERSDAMLGAHSGRAAASDRGAGHGHPWTGGWIRSGLSLQPLDLAPQCGPILKSVLTSESLLGGREIYLLRYGADAS